MNNLELSKVESLNEWRFAVVIWELTKLFNTKKVAEAFAESEWWKVISITRKRLYRAM